MAEEERGAAGVAALAEANAPVFETLVRMTLDTFGRSGLDQETCLLARIAALVAIDASAPSYLLNIGTAAEVGVPMEKIRGTLVAIAPRGGQRPRRVRRPRHQRRVRAGPLREKGGKDDRPGLTSGSGRLAHPGPKAPLSHALRPRTQTTPNRRSNGQLCESRL